MICKNCGREIADGASFCTNCGTKVDISSVANGQADERTMIIWDEVNPQAQGASQDSDRTVVLWNDGQTQDSNAANTSQDSDHTVVILNDAQQPSSGFDSNATQDSDRTMVMWDDAPAGTGSSDVPQSTNNVICPNCGAANSAGMTFCVSCGAMMSQQSRQINNDEIKVNIKDKAVNKKLAVCMAAIAVIAVVAVIAIVFKPSMPFGKGRNTEEKKSTALYYIRDDEAYIYRNGLKQSKLITDDEGFYNAKLSDDGKCLYYIEKDKDEETGTLLYKELNSDDEAVELDDDVDVNRQTYVLSNKNILYVKDNKIYRHNLKEAQKIASIDAYFYVSKNNKYVYWYDDNDLIIQDIALKNDKIKIKNVAYLEYINDDLSDILYIGADKGGGSTGELYHYKDLKESEKVASDVSYTIVSEENSKIYYYVEDRNKEYSLYDLAKDDVKSDDNTYLYCRDDLEYTDVEHDQYTIYEYNFSNGKSQKIMETERLIFDGEYILRDFFAIDDKGEPVIVYYEAETEDVFKMSDAVKYYFDSDLECYVKDQLEEATRWNLFYKGNTYEIAKAGDVEGIFTDIIINEATQEIYLTAEDYYNYDNSSSYYKLYACKYKTQDRECKWITDDYVDWRKNSEGIYYMCREADDREGELYLNGNEIDRRVYDFEVSGAFQKGCLYAKDEEAREGFFYNGKEVIELGEDIGGAVLFLDDGKSIAYFADYDNHEGTLYICNGKTTVAIDEDVYAAVGLGDGKIAYIKDWSEKREEGDLYIFNGKKSVELDSDVSYIGTIEY